MTTGFMMGYKESDAFGAADNMALFVDHRFQRVYNSVQTQGIRYFDAYPNGVEIVGRSVADIGVASVYGPAAFLYNSQQVAWVESRSNSSAIAFMRATDLSLVKVFGSNNSSFTNGSFNVETPDAICSIVGPFGNDTLICNTQYTDGCINVIDTVAMANRVTRTLTENHAAVGAVPDGSGTVAYILGYTKLGGATANGLYTIDGSGNLTRLASIAPATVDATWTNFAASYGVSVDQTDGNPICAFSTADAVTHRAYICKFNKTTGALIWAIPVAGNPGGINYSHQGMSNNLIKNGRLYYLGTDAGHPFYTINTIAGTFTTSVLSDWLFDGLHGDQTSEDVTDSIYWFGSWSENTTHPAYIGNYMLTQGHTSGSAMVFRYFADATLTPPVPGVPAQSRKRAWTYTLDGHVMYVLDLGGEGTWVYDDTTSEWSEFTTQNISQWNFTNGTMWGQRIVGGDVLASKVWEMAPSALKDNGSVDVVHVVTGGLTKRTRVYSSVESFRMNVSVGQLDNTAGASISLAFSDDQGQTWTTMPSITLTEGDYSGEIAWRSLGSFAAPGRIFRITDTGGFLRIDGADANLDNFDEDVPNPSQQQGG